MTKSPTRPARRARPIRPSAPRRLRPPDEFDAWLDRRLREIFAPPEILPPRPDPRPLAEPE